MLRPRRTFYECGKRVFIMKKQKLKRQQETAISQD